MDDGERIYFTVSVLEGPKALLKSIQKCRSTDHISDIVGRFSTIAENPVSSVYCGEKMGCATTEIELSTPCGVVRNFGFKYIEVRIFAPEAPSKPPIKTMFDVMNKMAACKTNLPPKK